MKSLTRRLRNINTIIFHNALSCEVLNINEIKYYKISNYKNSILDIKTKIKSVRQVI